MARIYVFLCLVMLGLAGAVLAPLDVSHDALLRETLDAGHYPLFAVVAFAIYLAIGKFVVQHEARIIAAGITSGVLAIAVEKVQPLVSRTASRADIINGCLGVAAALLCVTVWHRTKHLAPRIASVAIAACGLLWVLRPAYGEWKVRRWQDARYPQLAGFEQSVERRLWYSHGSAGKRPVISLSREQASEGQQSLRVQTPGTSWNAVGFAAHDRDWSTAKELALDVYSAGDLERLQVQVVDAKGTKFERWNPIAAGWNHIRIPAADIRLGRGQSKLSLDSVRYLVVLVHKSAPPALYYLDNVRIIK